MDVQQTESLIDAVNEEEADQGDTGDDIQTWFFSVTKNTACLMQGFTPSF